MKHAMTSPQRAHELAASALCNAFPESTQADIAFAMFNGWNAPILAAALQMPLSECVRAVKNGTLILASEVCPEFEELFAKRRAALHCLAAAGPFALRAARQAGPKQCLLTWAVGAAPRLRARFGASL